MGKARKHAPNCPYCGERAGLVLGSRIYLHRPDLADKPFYRCGPCDAHVGCHPGTTKPLGTPANAELRRARVLLHNERFDPIWMHAEACGSYNPESPKAVRIIRSSARRRLYAWLADQLGIARDDCHTALFDLEQCRKAWILLKDVNYADVRRWWKEQERADRAAA